MFSFFCEKDAKSVLVCGNWLALSVNFLFFNLKQDRRNSFYEHLK